MTLPAGASTSVTLTMVATKAAPKGDAQAWLTVKAGSTLLAHSAVYVLLK